jgi:hypothetical protein
MGHGAFRMAVKAGILRERHAMVDLTALTPYICALPAGG